MMYDISIKNFNDIEVIRGQNLTEELAKLTIATYSNYPKVTIWKSPEPEERNQAISCAEFLKDYCLSNSCYSCKLYNHHESECMVEHPSDWELKEGEPNE